MTFVDWKAGAKITPAKLTAMQTQVICAVNTQTVNNSAVLVNDNELVVPLAANAQYIVEVHAIFTSTTGTDFQTGWSVPSGTTGTRMSLGATNTGGNYMSATDTRARFPAADFTATVRYTCDTNMNFVQEYAYVTTSSTAGNLTFQWAQGAAAAVNTVRQAMSYMKIQRFV